MIVSDKIDGESSQAADRYAQAAFELGMEQKALDALEEDFALMAQAFAASDDLRAVAASPLIDPHEKARAFVAVAERIGVSPLGRNLVGVIVQNRRAAELLSVGKAFAAQLARHRGVSMVEIISAKPLSAEEESQIVAAVAKALNTKVAASKRVDESLIGGFIVRAGSRQFDASIRAKLDSLRLALKSA